MNRLIKISKTDYYNNYFTLNKTNMRNIWRGIKQIISLKPMSGGGGVSSRILEGDNVLTDSKSIAGAFNDFFVNIANNLAVSINSVDVTLMDYMPPKQSNSIFLYPITSVKIEVEINNLNYSKATGPFSIPINILKITKNKKFKTSGKYLQLFFVNGYSPKQL